VALEAVSTFGALDGMDRLMRPEVIEHFAGRRDF
jgi:hypothetical protein